jgi:hypothetical protein
MAKAYKAPIDPPGWVTPYNYDEQQRREQNYIDTLAAMAKENGKSDLLGQIVRWQRGDGYAEFMVWNTKPLELIHLEIGDAWDVEEALIRGLRISDIKEMIERDRRWQELINGLPSIPTKESV